MLNFNLDTFNGNFSQPSTKEVKIIEQNQKIIEQNDKLSQALFHIATAMNLEFISSKAATEARYATFRLG